MISELLSIVAIGLTALYCASPKHKESRYILVVAIMATALWLAEI